MKYLRNKATMLVSVFTMLVLLFYIQSCKKDDLSETDNNIEMSSRLSDYNIFQGNQSDLLPTNGFELYEISTQLFSDHAEKQRLVKVPGGSKINAADDGLLDFPDGTILVKTFYYFNDKRDISKGKKIIETRLLIKSNSKWNVGTYLWNNEQTDANLLTTGLNKTINWINESGTGKVFSYHVPNNRECATCHSSKEIVVPIGPKARNLNFDVIRSSTTVNQLTHFENIGILNSVDPSSFSTLPNWLNTTVSVENRARAYLDINCAHCHSQNGKASDSRIFLGYELQFNETKISTNETAIKNAISSGKMPMLGTTTIDEEGLLLVKAYIDGL